MNRRNNTSRICSLLLLISAFFLVLVLALWMGLAGRFSGGPAPEGSASSALPQPEPVTPDTPEPPADSSSSSGTVDPTEPVDPAEPVDPTEAIDPTEGLDPENTGSETEPAPPPEAHVNPGALTGTPREILAQMTRYEKICQLFVVYPSDITGVAKVTAAGETTRKALEQYPVGGFLYDARNLVTWDQTHAMIQGVQSFSKIPLIITCDEEGGRVSRLMRKLGTTQVGPMMDYKDQGPETATANAKTIADDLLACGFNMDLAPVADVWSNPQNTVIGDRAYSDDFEQAAQLIPAAVKGFHQGGVACTLKHFPGHGCTSADTHYGSAYIYTPLEELRQKELLPFQAGIDAGADAVMMGHLIIADVDPEPALFSHKLVTELLRQEMGFDGVVITDGLRMQAMTDHYGSGEIAVKAIQAGVDILLCPADLNAAITALDQAVESGQITEQRLDDSVLRILQLKQDHGFLNP